MRRLVQVELVGGPMDGELRTIDHAFLPHLVVPLPTRPVWGMDMRRPLPRESVEPVFLETATYTARIIKILGPSPKHYSIEDQILFLPRLKMWYDQR